MNTEVTRAKLLPPSDNNVIHVDFSQDRSGVTAALRQAYSCAGHEPSDHDFDRILKDLH